MALKDLTATAVREALNEFDRIGRDAFLAKYDYGELTDYVIVENGRFYDSKAIAGAAHGYLPGRVAMKHDEFSGGIATVLRRMYRLGFTIGTVHGLPVPGEVLTNKQINRRFAVGVMGGMRRSTVLNLLVLISDPFKGLYQDRWEGDVLHYTGMGPTGEQSLTYGQNRTLAESRSTGIPVHLLEALEPMKYTYVGQVELVGDPYQEEQLDDDDRLRPVWMFPLRLKSGAKPTATEPQVREVERSKARIARRLSTKQLKARAQRATSRPRATTVNTTVYVRDAAVAEYAKRMANGHCDLCKEPAPFKNEDNLPYLECHHVDWLAHGGEDTIANTVALCPNCHRKMHVLNLKSDQHRLRRLAAGRLELSSD